MSYYLIKSALLISHFIILPFFVSHIRGFPRYAIKLFS